VWKLIK